MAAMAACHTVQVRTIETLNFINVEWSVCMLRSRSRMPCDGGLMGLRGGAVRAVQ